jgi:cholesterol transport system auxiliary component
MTHSLVHPASAHPASVHPLFRNIRRIGMVLAAAAALAGCGSGLLPGITADPPQLFVLTPKSTFSKNLPRVDWQLTIDKPIAQAGLATARIALRQNPISLEYYARANWIDTAPQMVQTLLVESFENSNRIISVGRQSVTLRADYSLLTELREFQAEYDGPGPPKARVRINAKLVKMPQRIIIATLTVERIQPAARGDMKAVVEAFDSALGKALKRIVEWTLISAPPRKRR